MYTPSRLFLVSLLTFSLALSACYTGSRKPKTTGGTAGGGSTQGLQADANEPNDSSAAATVASLPFAQSNLTIHTATDQDFFSVPATAGDTLTVSITFTHANGNLDLQLQDSTGAAVASSTGTVDNESLTYNATATGTYFARVYGAGGAMNTYTIGITSSSGGGGGGTLSPDALEPNDSVTSSRAVTLPWNASNLTIHSSTDADYYRFTLSAASSVTATINFTHLNGDLDMTLESDTGTVIQGSYGVTDTETVTTSLQAGTYLLHVYGYSGATNTYTASITATTSGGGGGSTTGDPFEPNNSTTAAAQASVPWNQTNLSLHDSNDVDYYKVTLSANQTITVTMTFNNNLNNVYSDIDMNITDSTGAVGAGSYGVSGTETFTVTVPTAGTYFIKVYWYTANPSGNPYTLQIQ